jgi:hypothetical protein
MEIFMTRKVSVTLIGLKCFAVGPDPGSSLEVYGDLAAKRSVLDELGNFRALQTFPLWHKSPQEWVNITRDTTLSVNTTTPEITIEPQEYLLIGGHLGEQDEWPSANDNLGFVDMNLSHDVLHLHSGLHVVTFQEEGQVVEARFTISLIA